MAMVEDGWVTLTGEVDWSYQIARTEQCIRPLSGVRGLDNLITIRPRASSKDIGEQITAALTRQAMREARHISVEVEVEGGMLHREGHRQAPKVAALRQTDWRPRPCP